MTELKSDRHRNETGIVWLLVTAIGIVTYCCYSNSMQAPMVLDDLFSLENNPAVRRISIVEAMRCPRTALTLLGRPVVTVSFQMNHVLSGSSLFGFHATNVLIHFLAGLALFGLVRRTLSLERIAERYRQRATLIASAITLLWVSHPLQTESVTYLVQRTESMAGLFYLFGLYAAVRANDQKNRVVWQTLSVLSCLFGMGSKEVVVSLPIVVIYYYRIFVDGSWREGWQRRGWFYFALLTTWIPLGALVVLSKDRGGSAGFSAEMSVQDYFFNQPAWLLWYLRLCFIPAPLTLDYGRELITDSSTISLGVLGLLLVLLSLLLIGRKIRWLNFVTLACAAHLAPTSSIIPLYGQVAAEHRMYVPLAGVVTLTVIALFEVWFQFRALTAKTVKKSGWELGILGSSIGCLVLLCILTTRLRNTDYSDPIRLWGEAVRVRPTNSRATANLGMAYLARKDSRNAKHWLRESLKLRRDSDSVYISLGCAEAMDRNEEEAYANFSRALELGPNYARAFGGRALVSLGRKNWQNAIDDFRQAMNYDPDSWEYRFGYACALRDQGELDQALIEFNELVRLNPSNFTLFWQRAKVFARLGRTSQAADDLARFASLRANRAETSRAIDLFWQQEKNTN